MAAPLSKLEVEATEAARLLNAAEATATREHQAFYKSVEILDANAREITQCVPLHTPLHPR